MQIKSIQTTVYAMLLCSALATSGMVWAHDEHASKDIGEPGDGAKVTRVVTIDMSDTMRFNPSTVQVRQGETIRFVVKNSGKVKHEFVLGSAKEIKEHYQKMMMSMEMDHSDPNMVSLAPGGTGELIWKFSKIGHVDFACLQPGHYDAGMKGSVTVSPNTQP